MQGEEMEKIDPQQTITSIGAQVGNCVTRGMDKKLALIV